MGEVRRYFHVDREERLPHRIEPVPVEPSDPNLALLAEWFPAGMSEWGRAMLLDDTALTLTIETLIDYEIADYKNGDAVVSKAGRDALRASKDRMIEVLAEVIRQSVAPAKPSRLNCVFAYESLAQAQAFRLEANCPTAPIWELDAPPRETVLHADSRLAGVPQRARMLVPNLMLYWREARPPGSLPTQHEALLPLPATVLRRAE